MTYREFPQRDWVAFRNVGDAAIAIDQQCLSILSGLREAFLGDSILGSRACSLELTGNSTSPATFDTPFGEGRIVRSYFRHGEELQGVLVLQRKSVDEFDRDMWVPVWKLTVPRYDSPFIGTSDNGLRFHSGRSARSRSIEMFTMAMTMLDAMVDHS